MGYNSGFLPIFKVMIEQKLKDNDVKPTAVRINVLSVLMESATALSAKELENRLELVDKVTLYRTLKTFEEKKIIHTIQDGTNELKYAACEEGCECAPKDQHVHFHCQRCDETYCFTEAQIPSGNIPKIFTPSSVSMVFQGICSRCQ